MRHHSSANCAFGKHELEPAGLTKLEVKVQDSDLQPSVNRLALIWVNKYSLRVSPETHVVGSRSKNFSGQINRNCVTDLDKARTVWKWIDFTASKAYCPHDLPVFSLTCGSPPSRRPTVNDFSTAGSRRSLRQERQA